MALEPLETHSTHEQNSNQLKNYDMIFLNSENVV